MEKLEFNAKWALSQAVEAGKLSHCAKSKRGVFIWHRNEGPIASGWNHQPKGFACDGSDACRQACDRICLHAEEHAILQAKRSLIDCEMIHVKIVDGEAVASGQPSCWQCSRTILESGLKYMWLLHEDWLKSYTPHDFHVRTLKNQKLPIKENLNNLLKNDNMVNSAKSST